MLLPFVKYFGEGGLDKRNSIQLFEQSIQENLLKLYTLQINKLSMAKTMRVLNAIPEFLVPEP